MKAQNLVPTGGAPMSGPVQDKTDRDAVERFAILVGMRARGLAIRRMIERFTPLANQGMVDLQEAIDCLGMLDVFEVLDDPDVKKALDQLITARSGRARRVRASAQEVRSKDEAMTNKCYRVRKRISYTIEFDVEAADEDDAEVRSRSEVITCESRHNCVLLGVEEIQRDEMGEHADVPGNWPPRPAKSSSEAATTTLLDILRKRILQNTPRATRTWEDAAKHVWESLTDKEREVLRLRFPDAYAYYTENDPPSGVDDQRTK